jgi:hypothetical protein
VPQLLLHARDHIPHPGLGLELPAAASQLHVFQAKTVERKAQLHDTRSADVSRFVVVRMVVSRVVVVRMVVSGVVVVRMVVVVRRRGGRRFNGSSRDTFVLNLER